MKLRFGLLILVFVLFAGCGSKYTYYVEPTPLKEGETKYHLSQLKVDLTFGHGNLNDGRFENEEELTETFRKAILKNLKEKSILAETKENADAFLTVVVKYKRTFNWGGKALNKPEFSYYVNIFNKDDVRLASFSRVNKTTAYGTIGDLAVAAQIAAFTWGKEDEPKDVNQIALSIAGILSEIGD